MSKNYDNRESWLKIKLSAIPSGSSIIDVGAGDCPHKNLCGHLNYVSQDFCQYKPGATGIENQDWKYGKIDIVSPIYDIPVSGDAYDSVLCTEVLEHVFEPIRVISEIVRILKPGGVLILTAPVCSTTHQNPYYFYNGFSENWYIEAMKRNGMDIVEIEHSGNFYDYHAQELAKIPEVASAYNGDAMRGPNKLESDIIDELNLYSSKDGGSGKMLCFGIHVLARKKHYESI